MDIAETVESVLVLIAVVIATSAALSVTSIEYVSSPITVSVLILLVAFTAQLILVYSADDKLRFAGYIIVSIYATAVLTYLISVFSVPPIVQSVLLLAVAGAILCGVYAFREGIELLTVRNLGIIVSVLLIASVSVGAVDTLSAEPTDKVVPADTLTVSDDQRSIVIGHVVAQNPSVLPQSYDANSYVACTSADISARERPASRHIGHTSIYDDIIWDRRSVEMELSTQKIAVNSSDSAITVKRTESCPEEIGNGTIAVYQQR